MQTIKQDHFFCADLFPWYLWTYHVVSPFHLKWSYQIVVKNDVEGMNRQNIFIYS